MSQDFWTDVRTDTMRTMAAGHHSANEIAFEIGNGITRNAVCGKAYRMGIQLSGSNRGARTNRISRKGIPKPRRNFIPRWADSATGQPEIVELAVEPPSELNVTFIAREPHQCAWPVAGEPGPDMICCGAPRLDDEHPYCGWHCRVAYLPSRERRA